MKTLQEALKDNVSNLTAEERRLTAMLASLRERRKILRAKCNILIANESRVDALEYEHRACINKKKLDDIREVEKKQARQHVLDEAKARLAALVGMNVYNVAFSFGMTGRLGQ